MTQEKDKGIIASVEDYLKIERLRNLSNRDYALRTIRGMNQASWYKKLARLLEFDLSSLNLQDISKLISGMPAVSEDDAMALIRTAVTNVPVSEQNGESIIVDLALAKQASSRGQKNALPTFFYNGQEWDPMGTITVAQKLAIAGGFIFPNNESSTGDFSFGTKLRLIRPTNPEVVCKIHIPHTPSRAFQSPWAISFQIIRK